MKFQATALVFLAACAQALVIPKEFSNLAKKCAIPDGILTAIHTTNCDASVPIQVSKTTILKTSDGTPMYPVNVKIPMTLDLIASNNGNVEYQANRVHVKLFEFSENWLTGKCEWAEIPTFGLLDNIDGCAYAHNCPLKTGNLDLKLPLDLSSFSAIISVVAGDKPYKLEIRMFNYNAGDSKHELFACVDAELLFEEPK